MSDSGYKILIYHKSKLIDKIIANRNEYFNLILGRDENCQVQISDKIVSHQHAQLIFCEEGLFIQDLSSSNGTYLNRIKLNNNELTRLNLNDKIQFSISDKIMISVTEFSTQEEAVYSDSIISKFKSKNIVVLGRDKNVCDIVIDNPTISRKHATIVKKKGAYIISDEGSTNGVFINGRKIRRSVTITKSDVIFIGSHKISLEEGVSDLNEQLAIYSNGIEKVYNNSIVGLQSTHLSLTSNKLVAIMGPSGCGKSTLLKALNGDTPPTKGQVFLFDLELTENYEYLKTLIGYVPQDDIVHSQLTVKQCLYYSARLRNIPEENIENRITEVLKDLKIEERRNSLISALSGGQKKRVSIALELLSKPLLLFLDEPTSPLDPYVIKEFLDILKELTANGTTVIMVTHKPDDLEYMDEVIFMAEGGAMAYHGDVTTYKKYFEVTSPVDVYHKISGKNAIIWIERFRNNQNRRNTQSKQIEGIKNKSSISVVYQFYWLLSRYIKIKTQDKGNFYLMLIQAPIIAVLICMIFSDVTGAVPFISAIAAIWFGSNNSAKEIVSEMAIYKRERMYNLSIFPYIFSKISVLSLFSIVQSAIYILIIYIYFSNQTVELVNPIQAFCWMSFVSIVSSLFGLCISSLSKTTEIVMTTVPIVLIPQIMLAGLIAKIGSPIVEFISYLTLSRWATEGFNIIQEKIMVVHTYYDEQIGMEVRTEKPSPAKDVLYGQFHESYQDLPFNGTLALDFIVLSSMFVVFLFVIHYSLKQKDPLKI